MLKKSKKIIREARSLATLVLIVFLLKVTIVEAYIVPTGSMEDTIMTGDFLIGSRFNYGMRSPDWIGIPYTDKGFDIPYIRFPKFKEPRQGDVIIFKYPRDRYYKYVKRCIAEPGDSVKIDARKVFVNGIEYPLSENGKFVSPMMPEGFQQNRMFHSSFGINKDHFKTFRIPQKGDHYKIVDGMPFINGEQSDWRFLLPLILLDGHSATLENQAVSYQFTMTDPNDLFRRKGTREVYNDYFPNGTWVNPWSASIKDEDFQFLHVEGKSINEMDSYTIKQDYYWAMGDNRDDSLDSRFWGFVPFNHILGEALFVYFSLNLDTWIPRFNRIATVLK